MKTNSRQTADLKALRNIVMRWAHEPDGTLRKEKLNKRMSAANDKFAARWKRDGVAMLVMNGKGK